MYRFRHGAFALIFFVAACAGASAPPPPAAIVTTTTMTVTTVTTTTTKPAGFGSYACYGDGTRATSREAVGLCRRTPTGGVEFYPYRRQ